MRFGGAMLEAVKAIVVCDDEISRKFLGSLFANFKGIESVREFENPALALKYARKNPIAFAVLDNELLGTEMHDLERELRRLYPNILMVYISSNCYQAKEVVKPRGDYCFMISFDQADILNIVQRARLLKEDKKIRVVMFGRFQFFVRDQLVYFTNAKAKELLALCLDHRGGEVSMEEAVDKLWPSRLYDDKVKKLYRKAVTSLQSTLREAGVEEIFITRRGACYVDVDGIECDYYSFLEDRNFKKCLYDGSYLFDYDWGEETLALLERIVSDLKI